MELPELIARSAEAIARSAEAYERLALDLAANPERLSAIKAKHHVQRSAAPLFKTELFTRHLEAGYRKAYRRYFDGEPPAHLSVLNHLSGETVWLPISDASLVVAASELEGGRVAWCDVIRCPADLRTASRPAVISTASKGRTKDCTRPN